MPTTKSPEVPASNANPSGAEESPKGGEKEAKADEGEYTVAQQFKDQQEAAKKRAAEAAVEVCPRCFTTRCSTTPDFGPLFLLNKPARASAITWNSQLSIPCRDHRFVSDDTAALSFWMCGANVVLCL